MKLHIDYINLQWLSINNHSFSNSTRLLWHPYSPTIVMTIMIGDLSSWLFTSKVSGSEVAVTWHPCLKTCPQLLLLNNSNWGMPELPSLNSTLRRTNSTTNILCLLSDGSFVTSHFIVISLSNDNSSPIYSKHCEAVGGCIVHCAIACTRYGISVTSLVAFCGEWQHQHEEPCSICHERQHWHDAPRGVRPQVAGSGCRRSQAAPLPTQLDFYTCTSPNLL